MPTFSHYDFAKIQAIASGLPSSKNASELADLLCVDVSGLIKHIRSHLTLKETSACNKCGMKLRCELDKAACDDCHYKGKAGRKLCKTCARGCNQICGSFTRMPSCPKIRKFPYCCNGCKDMGSCHLSKLIYDPNDAWKAVSAKRSESRKGAHADDGEMARLSALLVPLIKGKKQSLGQVFLTHRAEIGRSYPTILSYIDKGLIPGLINLDMPKRCKYPKSYAKRSNEPTNAAFLSGRTYDDFIREISENPGREVVEMDTVVSGIDGKGAVLTLLFRKSNFMIAYLLPRKTSEEVSKIFEWLQKWLGDSLFSETFGLILTDNGSEFADPRSMEFSKATGAKLSSLFYCDPGKSGQKGKIEKNHVELRKVYPKSYDFSKTTQHKLNIALSNVNSEPRACLNGNSPSRIAEVFISKKVLELNEHQTIEPDMVFLSPKLVE